jgi:hypothetical protein
LREESRVSEASRVPRGEAFGAASRASDYLEEETAEQIGAVPIETPPAAGLRGDSGAARSTEGHSADYLLHGVVDRSTTP